MVRYCKSPKSLVGKTTIVTGANTGIGYETALEFAKRGARVILACRDQQRANDARDRICKETGSKNVVVKLIDMSSLSSVRGFSKEIHATEARLDILVNNSGAYKLPEKITDDGLQLMMQVNHFGPFLLTNLLLDLLEKSAPSRIVNVSSAAAQMVRRYSVDDLNKFTGDMTVYAQTKLCNILFTQELARRVGVGVTTYSLHPGLVATDLTRSASFFKFVGSWVGLTPEEGAQTQIYLSLQDGIQHVSGQHFDNCKRVKPYRAARDPELAKQVWKRSMECVGLEETKL